MAFPGWSATLPTDILPNSGAIYLGANGSGLLLGRTVGGITFDPGRSVEPIKFDGLRAPVRGLHWITDYKAMIKTKLIQFSSTTFTDLEPGWASASGSAGVSTYYTLQQASTLFAPGSYLTDVRAIWKRSDGSYFQIRMHYALVEKYTLAAKDKNIAEIDAEFHGVVDPTQTNPATGTTYTTDDAPYMFESLYSNATL